MQLACAWEVCLCLRTVGGWWAACSSLVGQTPSSGDGFSAFAARRLLQHVQLCQQHIGTEVWWGTWRATLHTTPAVLHGLRLCMRMHAGLMHGRCCHLL